MNRREAIAALVALPSVANIQTANLAPDDVIVIECDGHLSLEAMEHVERVWPGRKCVVLSNGLHMKVVRE